jgi:hypothetical protein
MSNVAISQLWLQLFFTPSLTHTLTCADWQFSTTKTTSVTNLVPTAQIFSQKQLFKHFIQYSTATRAYYEDAVVLDILIRFMEHLSMHRVWLVLNRLPQSCLTQPEFAYITLLTTRLQRLFRPAALQHWADFGICILLMFRSKDPQYLLT